MFSVSEFLIEIVNPCIPIGFYTAAVSFKNYILASPFIAFASLFPLGGRCQIQRGVLLLAMYIGYRVLFVATQRFGSAPLN